MEHALPSVPQISGEAFPERYYVIVEQPGLTDQQRDYWLHSSLSRQPLMHQQAFAPLRDEGPWLVMLGEDFVPDLEQLRQDLGPNTLQAWLSSHLSLADLSQHLGEALVAQGVDGQSLLLRSYAPTVLPILHARTDCAWHAWLLGPVNNWWLVDGQNTIQRYQGHGSHTLPEYSPVTLDMALTEALSLDQQALALLDELQRTAPQAFSSDCHGDRLAQVEQALAMARKARLPDAGDQTLFATLHLLEGRPPSQSPHWPTVMRLVTEQGHDLGRALDAVTQSATA